MQKTNLLGLRVVGITVILLLVLFGLYWGARTILQREAARQSAGEAQEGVSLAERTRDSDGDGVADMYENVYYKTDPNNVDTDGDGLSDLDEITSGRDPLIPGPNDESRPATGSQITDPKTFTQRYLAELPDDISRDEILSQVRLESFVDANRGKLVPDVLSSDTKTTAETGKEVISNYLNAVSSAHNSSLKPVTSADIEAAFRLQVNSQQPQPMQDLVTVLTSNVKILKEVSAPSQVADLHTKLLAASISLRDNADLLHRVNQDFVGGLIAAKNIEELGSVFQEIAQDISALEKKYGLE